MDRAAADVWALAPVPPARLVDRPGTLRPLKESEEQMFVLWNWQLWKRSFRRRNSGRDLLELPWKNGGGEDDADAVDVGVVAVGYYY